MQPSPFVIQQLENGVLVASNGAMQIVAPDRGSELFLRRGIRGIPGGPVAEKILPQINLLAGDLLANSAMPAQEVAARLHLLMAACDQPEPENLECCVAQLDGVRAYVQQSRVILTRQDIQV